MTSAVSASSLIVVLKEGFARSADLCDAVQTFVKQTIAPYKYPRTIKIVDALPRTETGKLQRFRLRELADRAASCGTGTHQS